MEQETAEDIKRHFDVVAQGLREEIGNLRSEVGGLNAGIGDTRRHINVVAESLRSDIRTVAEGFVATNERLDRFEVRMSEKFGEMEALFRLSFTELDRRIQSL
jgi:hypothetical protein